MRSAISSICFSARIELGLCMRETVSRMIGCSSSCSDRLRLERVSIDDCLSAVPR